VANSCWARKIAGGQYSMVPAFLPETESDYRVREVLADTSLEALCRAHSSAGGTGDLDFPAESGCSQDVTNGVHLSEWNLSSIYSKEIPSRINSSLKFALALTFVACLWFLSMVSSETADSTIESLEPEIKIDLSTGPEAISGTNQRIVKNISRAFRWVGREYAWCVEPWEVANSSSPIGIFFVKVAKTASSTGAGVTIRLAINLFHRRMKPGDDSFMVGKNGCIGCCQACYQHGRALANDYKARERGRSFLWSIVRDPAKRAVSHVFFKGISREGIEPSDENVIGILKGKKLRNYQMRYLKLEKGRTSASNEDAVRDIIHNYDFLAVTERMDESLVAMKLILKLDFGDFLYISSKINGGYDDGRSRYGCVKLVHPRISEAVDDYLLTEFRQMNQRDYLLYEAVNLSLNKTIQWIGEERFKRELKQYRFFLERAKEICKPTAVFPCSPEGILQRKKSDANCYFDDWGCGYPCIDQFIVSFEANKFDNVTGG